MGRPARCIVPGRAAAIATFWRQLPPSPSIRPACVITGSRCVHRCSPRAATRAVAQITTASRTAQPIVSLIRSVARRAAILATGWSKLLLAIWPARGLSVGHGRAKRTMVRRADVTCCRSSRAMPRPGHSRARGPHARIATRLLSSHACYRHTLASVRTAAASMLAGGKIGRPRADRPAAGALDLLCRPGRKPFILGLETTRRPGGTICGEANAARLLKRRGKTLQRQCAAAKTRASRLFP